MEPLSNCTRTGSGRAVFRDGMPAVRVCVCVSVCVRVHEAGAVGKALVVIEGGGEEPGWHLRCPRCRRRKSPARPASAGLGLQVAGSGSNGVCLC